MKRICPLLILALVTLAASAAGATEYGYAPNFRDWHANVFVSPVVQFQAAADDYADPFAMLATGGVSVNRIANFSCAVAGEYGKALTDPMQQGRLEMRFGWRYLTAGPTLTFTSDEEQVVTIGPVLSFDYPIYFVEGTDQHSFVLGAFYRLDFPTDNESEIRHQIGVRLGYSHEAFMTPFRMPANLFRSPALHSEF